MRKRTLSEFVYEAQKVHGNKYDYSRVVYESSAKRVCIICPEHEMYLGIGEVAFEGFGTFRDERRCIVLILVRA